MLHTWVFSGDWFLSQFEVNWKAALFVILVVKFLMTECCIFCSVGFHDVFVIVAIVPLTYFCGHLLDINKIILSILLF